MEFGVVAISALPPRPTMSSKQAFDYVMRGCQVAHDSGFEGIGISHKYLAGPSHQFLPPIPMAARVLGEYPDMYVGTNVYLLPYENPLRVAEDVATLDLIAPGRFLFGIGQGYRSNESQAFKVPSEERGRRMTESIAAMRALWKEGPCTFHGEFWDFEGADLSIKPATPNGPPVMMAADTLSSVAKVPERGGDHWLPSPRHSTTFLQEAVPIYREALERQGKAFRGLPMIRDMCVADSYETAQALVEDSIVSYLHLQAGWGQPGEDYTTDFDHLKLNRIILGTSEHAAQELVELHNSFGAEYVLFRLYTPGMDTERALDVIRKVGSEVLPLVRREVGSKSLFLTE